jgi:transcriptional antiterminator
MSEKTLHTEGAPEIEKHDQGRHKILLIMRVEEDVKSSINTEAKTYRVLQIIRLLCEYRYTLNELAEKFNIAPRTIERYLDILEFMDIPIEKDFKGKYFIVQGGCPLCGHTTNNTLR